MKFSTRVCLKPWNDRGEFELDRARSKNNSAENSVALGHETHNTLIQINTGVCIGCHEIVQTLLYVDTIYAQKETYD